MFESKDRDFAHSNHSAGMTLADATGLTSAGSLQNTGSAKPGWREKLAAFEFAPDLGDNIGTSKWFRGLGTFAALCIGALAFLPDFGPLYGAQPRLATEAEFDEARAQMIMPIAFGSDSGKRMAAIDNVVALAASPERPTIEMTAMLGRGDSFMRVLQRAGVSQSDAARAFALVSGATTLDGVEAGTPIEIILGQRTARNVPRPLQSLVFRARFDLNLEVDRINNALQIKRLPIRVDDTPLRIRGTVGDGLYKSARAAGAPASAIQDFLRVISGHTSIAGLRESDEFDIIIDYRRAETGEVKTGNLLYAGIDRGGTPKVQLLQWNVGGSAQWFEASGVGKTQGAIGRPSNGAMTSSYGMRRHPILGYRRMHSGIDFGGGHGAPIFAVTDGAVRYAGRKGGYGNFVELQHSAGLGTGYAHMSRIAVRPGQRVRRGQIIGYIGSTGLSTGPHLHYELYRNGRPINPLSVKFTQRAQLSGPDLAKFRSRLNQLKSVKPGAALTPIQNSGRKQEPPTREIDRLSRRMSPIANRDS
jgi:murein DD-endopeptidase MepM/ murein hydrolase activator NlpD